MLATQTLDRWCHCTLDRIFSIFVWFSKCILICFYFFSPITSGNVSENLPGTSGTRTSMKCKKTSGNTSAKLIAPSGFPKKELQPFFQFLLLPALTNRLSFFFNESYNISCMFCFCFGGEGELLSRPIRPIQNPV